MNQMVIGFKDAAKLVGIMIIAFCAVMVCNMFLNFYIDLVQLEELIQLGPMQMLYEAQKINVQVTCGVTGGCLGATSVVMLIFYVRHYIDTHRKSLGILKAMGYSNGRIAAHFWVFGLSVLIGAALGYVGGLMMLPSLYDMFGKDGMLPDREITIHLGLTLYLIILPTVLFGALAMGYAWFSLRQPVHCLLRDMPGKQKVKKHWKDSKNTGSFLTELKHSTLKSKKALVFFMFFAAFCFSTMTQMAFSMKKLSSEVMAATILLIGLVLAYTTLLMSITTVITGNRKSIAIMRTFGYSQKECVNALLGGYRGISWIGFILGTFYQYGLLKVMVNVVYAGVEDADGMMAVYEFDHVAFWISAVIFAVSYEILMYVYSEKIKKLSVKEIMLE